MAHIIDGKKIAACYRESLKSHTAELKKRTGITPGLAVIIVGENPASKIYVRNKSRACADAGINFTLIELPENIPMDEFRRELLSAVENEENHGVLVQLPLPSQIDYSEVLEIIPPEKDVDGFNYVNSGKLFTGEDGFVPGTPLGVMKMLEYENISVDGRECVVIGRSNIVGKPMAALLLNENATVTVCHSHTKNLADVTRRADILISAVGRAGFVTADMVKDGAVVIDVGINRTSEGKLTGDVDFAPVSEKAAAITPVPGGVGVMTIEMLLENTCRAAENYARRHHLL